MVFFCILSPFFSFLPMNDPKAGVFCFKSNEYQNRSSPGSFLVLVTFNYLYLIFFYTLHTPVYLSHILFVPVKGVKGPFFSLERKEPKVQGCVC